MRKIILVFVLILFFSTQLVFAGTTGKIAGVVTDAENGAPLPGANIIIEGTTMGAAVGLNGYYVILNVPPGTYTLKASMMGYAVMTITQVRVNIDLTATIDFKMKPEVLMGEEVQVVAERPVVQKDVSASQANLSVADIEALPVVSVEGVVALEAGVRGMTIRGGGSDQTAFMVNGFTMRDERDNSPYTAISYTAIDEIQIQTGGFSAEYGNIRSGLIHVTTKEGKKDAYHFGLIARYRPAGPKHFGHSPNSPESYWIRPYVDDDVCWTGTDAWDKYTQRQYPGFEGWNSIVEQKLNNADPDDDLTPEAAQRLFLWEHRRQLDIAKPDYDVDLSFGGPIPFISEQLGNLRFFTSYRSSQEMYLVPLSDDAFRDYNWQLKLTSDIKPGMKLTIDGLLGQQTGTTSSRSGGPGIFDASWEIAEDLSRGPKYIDGRMYGTDYWCPTTILRNSVGAKLSHVLSPKTFYEVTLQRFASEYDNNPGARRDTSRVNKFGNNYYVDEAPFGFQPWPSTGIVGLRMGVGFSNSRDSSKIAVYSSKFDITSQIDKYNNIKAGIEFVYVDNNVNYAIIDSALTGSNQYSKWHTFPKRAALYIQDKLEFKSMIATLGLRLDYSHAGGQWYAYDNPYAEAFSAANYALIDTLVDKESTKRIFNLSPRLGIAFPITINSKLFFNYGHFRQIPTPENLYLIRRYEGSKALSRLANPNNPLPKTIAYELGYEHNIFNQFLLRLAGYYKDSSDQSRLVNYINLKNTVDYDVTEPNSYRDTRGFEFTLRKNRGNWVQGFINYTYQVTTYGYFGFRYYYENRSEQRSYERETRHHYQEKPVPRPFGRANVDFFTPISFGPKFLGIHPLGDWRLNVLADWRAGLWDTWTGGGAVPGIVNNVQWKDYQNVDLRFSKNFKFGRANVQFFIDMNNVFNYKYMTSSQGFVDAEDYNHYMKSLHLPIPEDDIKKMGYVNIYGDDHPGDYRRPGVAYQPIEAHQDISEVPPNDIISRVIYYEASTDKYLNYSNGQWAEVEKSRMKKVLDDKAYIDMPNQEFFAFLNPRNIFWGLRVSFDIR